mgnify:CR=1 FL=1
MGQLIECFEDVLNLFILLIVLYKLKELYNLYFVGAFKYVNKLPVSQYMYLVKYVLSPDM